MKTISETYGIERARTDGRFEKDREACRTVNLSQVDDAVLSCRLLLYLIRLGWRASTSV